MIRECGKRWPGSTEGCDMDPSPFVTREVPTTFHHPGSHHLRSGVPRPGGQMTCRLGEEAALIRREVLHSMLAYVHISRVRTVVGERGVVVGFSSPNRAPRPPTSRIASTFFPAQDGSDVAGVVRLSGRGSRGFPRIPGLWGALGGTASPNAQGCSLADRSYLPPRCRGEFLAQCMKMHRRRR